MRSIAVFGENGISALGRATQRNHRVARFVPIYGVRRFSRSHFQIVLSEVGFYW
jgi:hypothetical protein